MFRIWAKIITDGHIVKQITYASAEKFSYAEFFRYLSDICYQLDIPTPVLLKPHLFSYAKFNHVKFLPRDFLEAVPFQSLVLENLL